MVQNNEPDIKIKNKRGREREKKRKMTNIIFQTSFTEGCLQKEIILSKLGSGIILDIDILRTHLNERACSTNIELDGAEVNFREAFLSVHKKI